MTPHGMSSQLGRATAYITDPGDAKALPNDPVAPLTVVELVSAGAETRTLAAPVNPGVTLCLVCKTYVGNIVVTAASAINQAANTIMTFGAANDLIVLYSMSINGTLVWRIWVNDGVALS